MTMHTKTQQYIERFFQGVSLEGEPITETERADSTIRKPGRNSPLLLLFHDRFPPSEKECISVGLGTPLRRRETVRLHGTFPTEWPGFHPRMPWMGKTLVVGREQRFLPASGSATVGKNWWFVTLPYILGVRSQDDVAAIEAKAQSGNGLRVAVEASNKPPYEWRGLMTEVVVRKNPGNMGTGVFLFTDTMPRVFNHACLHFPSDWELPTLVTEEEWREYMEASQAVGCD